MDVWQMISIVLAVVALLLVMTYLIVENVIGKIFERVPRPKYSSLIQFKDVEKEYPYERLNFRSGEHRLQGYHLGKENTKGLVVVVHGLGGGAEGYLTPIRSFVDGGFQVFAYDNTGYHLSEGKNCVGLPQAVEDLDAALTFIENEERFNGLPVYLFGHSWGGYAVCAVLRTNHKIKAVASVAGFNNPNIMIVEWAKRVAGKWAYIAIPFMKINQRLSFGKKMDITAVDGINRANVPVLLVHGSEDATVRLNRAATFSCKEEITNGKVLYLLWEKEGQNGHLDVLYKAGAKEYGLQINKEYMALLKKSKKKLSEEDKIKFFGAVDKVKSSAPNEELMEKIMEFLEQALVCMKNYDENTIGVQSLLERVCKMERYMDEVLEALQNAPEKISEDNGLREKIEVLTNYMDSGQWLADYEADERGELPKELKRGVLSQDGLYNLICEIEEKERTS